MAFRMIRNFQIQSSGRQGRDGVRLGVHLSLDSSLRRTHQTKGPSWPCFCSSTASISFAPQSGRGCSSCLDTAQATLKEVRAHSPNRVKSAKFCNVVDPQSFHALSSLTCILGRQRV